MTAIVQIRGAATINRRLAALTKGFTARKTLAMIRPAAAYHVKEAKKELRKNIRSNKRNYPATHPARRKGTGHLLRRIKVDTKRRTLLVRSFGPHSWLVEFGHEKRGGNGRVRGYPFFLGIRRRIQDKQLKLVAAKVERALAKAAKS